MRRSLPRFQIFGGLDAHDADLEETVDHAGVDLACSRGQAWQDAMLRHTIDFSRKYESLSASIAAIERGHSSASTSSGSVPGGASSFTTHAHADASHGRGGSAIVYRYLLTKLLLDESTDRMDKEKKRPAGMQQAEVGTQGGMMAG